MKKGKSSLSQSKSYKELGAFWDTHDLSGFWEKTGKTEFKVDIKSEVTYYSLDKKLSERVESVAHRRGITADTLINLWVQEKLQEQ